MERFENEHRLGTHTETAVLCAYTHMLKLAVHANMVQVLSVPAIKSF